MYSSPLFEWGHNKILTSFSEGNSVVLRGKIYWRMCSFIMHVYYTYIYIIYKLALNRNDTGRKLCGIFCDKRLSLM